MRPAAALALLALAFAGPAPARASFLIAIDPTPSVPASSGVGSFTVTLTNDDPAQTLTTVNAFSLELSLPAGAGVIFTGVERPATGYIFDPAPTGDLSLDTFPTLSFVASDPSDLSTPSRTLALHQTVSLALVTYRVAPGTPGGLVPVSFLGGTSLTNSVIDGTGVQVDTPVPFRTQPGSIAVPGAVPEPPASVLAAVGLTLAAALRRRR